MSTITHVRGSLILKAVPHAVFLILERVQCSPEELKVLLQSLPLTIRKVIIEETSFNELQVSHLGQWMDERSIVRLMLNKVGDNIFSVIGPSVKALTIHREERDPAPVLDFLNSPRSGVKSLRLDQGRLDLQGVLEKLPEFGTLTHLQINGGWPPPSNRFMYHFLREGPVCLTNLHILCSHQGCRNRCNWFIREKTRIRTLTLLLIHKGKTDIIRELSKFLG